LFNLSTKVKQNITLEQTNFHKNRNFNPVHDTIRKVPSKEAEILNSIVTVCVFVCHMFSYHPFYFDFHSARVIFDVSSGFYFWNVNRTPTWHLSKMFKVAFKDVSTKNSEPTYWTILFVMLKIYFIYKVAWKKSRKTIKNWTMSSASQTPALPVMWLSCGHWSSL
jgi:hypothetical protein